MTVEFPLLPRLALTALVAAAAACGGRNPDQTRHELLVSSETLKRDSAATYALFETVMGDSVQRERLTRALLANEGMRRTLTQALIVDSLAKVPGAGVPTSRAPAISRSAP